MTLSVRFIVEMPAIYPDKEDGFKYLAVFSDGTCWGVDELIEDEAHIVLSLVESKDSGWFMGPVEFALLPQGTVVWADTDGVDLMQFMQSEELRGVWSEWGT